MGGAWVEHDGWGIGGWSMGGARVEHGCSSISAKSKYTYTHTTYITPYQGFPPKSGRAGFFPLYLMLCYYTFI